MIYSVGYAPSSFPRDPIDVNQIQEHMFLGQILEPLVESDRSGNVTRGIAETWKILDDGKRIEFSIGKRKFSTGKFVTAEDVVFSIGRHLRSRSQSGVFLGDVVRIFVDEFGAVVIELSGRNVAVLAALSREQLGILPSGWTFDVNSPEPYIGSGPYRLIKEDDRWVLVANSHYDVDSIPVRKWIVSSDPGEVPDYAPFLTKSSLDRFSSLDYDIRETISYSQTSFWIYPSSKFFRLIEDRKAFAGRLDTLVNRFATENILSRATGIFPLGILGHNPDPISLSGSSENVLATIAYLKGTFSPFAGWEPLHKLFPKLIPFDALSISGLRDQEIDVVTGSWAGGFADPTGFLGVLPMILGTDLKSYFGSSLFAILESAREESDPINRGKKFRTFDRALVETGLLVPGWRTPIYSAIKKPLRYLEFQSRFTERLVNIRP